MGAAILGPSTLAAALALALIGSATGAAPGPAAPGKGSPLSVMSYNVEGLPEPARFGRAGPLTAIGTRLAELRREQREPNVVLLQEAFATPAKLIAREGGYRYVASGPSAASVNDAPAPPQAASFLADASHLKGEDDGKWVDSGLRILSEYPIVGVRRLAFPVWDCAGYDCLANKGAVIAWIAVPGSPRPVAFIDTHLNSRAASGVAKARADIAYAYQVSALRNFISANVPPDAAAFLGGDFNSGKASARWADLHGGLLTRSRNSLLDAMVGKNLIPTIAQDDAQEILGRGKDWLFYRGNSSARVTLTGFDVPFGNDNGPMLSDHMGYEAHYNLRPAMRS